MSKSQIMLNVQVKTAPCKKCKKREIGCHSSCKKYQEFKKINEDANYKLKSQKYASSLSFGYISRHKR